MKQLTRSWIDRARHRAEQEIVECLREDGLTGVALARALERLIEEVATELGGSVERER